MKIIAHISDLHFGTEDVNVAEALLKKLHEDKPALIIISGDLTQRARTSQFKAAKEYLDKLPKPYLVIPGNHDIPLFDIFRRFLAPLTRYKKYISENLQPVFEDDEIAVMGINTARSFTWKDGRISHQQINDIKRIMGEISDSKFKIIVTHHPFIPPPHDELTDLVDRADLAMQVIEPCGIDLLLAGHIHHGYTGDIRKQYPAHKRAIVVAQAGTAISDRMRSEPNSYNHIVKDGNKFSICVRIYENGDFMDSKKIEYAKQENGWDKME